MQYYILLSRRGASSKRGKKTSKVKPRAFIVSIFGVIFNIYRRSVFHSKSWNALSSRIWHQVLSAENRRAPQAKRSLILVNHIVQYVAYQEEAIGVSHK